MTDKSQRLGRWIGVITMIVLAGTWGINQWHLAGLERELNALAQGRIEEFRPTQKALTVETGRVGSEVVVSKPYILFGAPEGKISVYIEHPRADTGPIVEGFEFFYVRESDASWTQTESGRCVSEQCQVDGKRVLDAFGETL